MPTWLNVPFLGGIPLENTEQEEMLIELDVAPPHWLIQLDTVAQASCRVVGKN